MRDFLKKTHGEGDAQTIYNSVKTSGDFISFAREFMYDDDPVVARNALWGLTKATNEELSVLRPILNEMIDLSMETTNSSVRRLLMNIIERLHLTQEELRTDFLDFCLDRMTAYEEFPGIQSLAIKLAARMCSFYPELEQELRITLEAMEMSYYKPAVKSARSKVLKKLKQ